jgi:hypothetical protein
MDPWISATQENKDRETRTQLSIDGELRCSGRIDSTYFTIDTTLVTKPVINEEGTGSSLRQAEHIINHLWNSSVTKREKR